MDWNKFLVDFASVCDDETFALYDQEFGALQDTRETVISKLRTLQLETAISSTENSSSASSSSEVQVTDECYKESWELLYKNKREIVYSTIQQLVKQPRVQEGSPSGLRKLLDTTTECVRVLKVIGAPVEHWDTILVSSELPTFS